MFSFELFFKMRQSIFKNHIQNFSPKTLCTLVYLVYLVVLKMCFFMTKLLLRKYKPEKKDTSWAVAQFTQSFEKTNKNRMNTSTAGEPVLDGVQHTALPKTMDLNQLGISLIHTHKHTHTLSINRQHITCTTSSCNTSFDTDLCLMLRKKTKIPIFHLDICGLLPSKFSWPLVVISLWSEAEGSL